MTVEKIRSKMLAHRDFFGGDIMWTDEIKAAKTKKELAGIMDRYRRHLESVACDAMSHHDNFKKELRLTSL